MAFAQHTIESFKTNSQSDKTQDQKNTFKKKKLKQKKVETVPTFQSSIAFTINSIW